MTRKIQYHVLCAIIGVGCLGVLGCAQTGVQPLGQKALLHVGVGVIFAEQCIEQGVGTLLGVATRALEGQAQQIDGLALEEGHRFACPSNGKVTLTLSHDHGAIYEVTLIKQGQSYTGPQGEYYPSIPSDEQLHLRYGRYSVPEQSMQSEPTPNQITSLPFLTTNSLALR